MKWSKYGHLFQSKRNGWLLYNSASNSFMKIENDETLAAVRQLERSVDQADLSAMPQLYLMLRAEGYIVPEGRDDEIYNILKMRRLRVNYASGTFLLTVAITRACNFDCSYCYEHSRGGVPMTEETADKVEDFVRRNLKGNALHVSWYGGEPLLAFDRVLYLDKKLQALTDRYSSNLITNGYLLTAEICEKLNDLKVKTVQITLDGNEATHDTRRCLLGGGKTFQKILSNIDVLMNSSYSGAVHIRVNVDTRNEDEFIEVYRLIQGKYPKAYGKKISVYPGFVKGDSHPDVNCFYDSGDKGRFVTKVARDYGVKAQSIFPVSPSVGCTLTRTDAYVVGPDGELYKCWDDVGVRECIVGYIDRKAGWNPALIAEGMVGASYLDSEECRQCFYFPICDGGCHKARMKNLHDGCKRDCCTYFKEYLDDLLEIYYEQKMGAGDGRK